jgi:hypothetical protein
VAVVDGKVRRSYGQPAQLGPSLSHAATPRREQGGTGEGAHREVGHGGGTTLPRRCSGEEGASPMGPRAAPAYGGAP